MKRRVYELTPREAFVYGQDIYFLLSTDSDRSGRLPIRAVGCVSDGRVILFMRPHDTVINPETEVNTLEHHASGPQVPSP